MLKNMLIIALRNFKRDKWYSLLNILGLTLGITFGLFLIFYIKDELSYDRYHQNADRIFRIVSFIKEPQHDMSKNATTQFPLGPVLKHDYPEVQEAVRFANLGRTMYKNGAVGFYENKVYFADSGLFRVFTYQFLEGNPQTALVEPNSMVLTQSVAKKYFGDTATIVGKTLKDDNGRVLKITAVVKDVPLNSHLLFNALVSISTLPKDFSDNWGGFGPYTYVLLKPNTDVAAFEKKLLPLYEKHMASIFGQYNIKIHYGAQPITAIHLHSEMVNEPEELGSIYYIYVFSAVALFMLLIACINYMNLTTARSARRAKEIGIRKVTGSLRWQLVVQFLTESVLTSTLAMLFSFLAIALLLPAFNSLAGKSIEFQTILQPANISLVLAVVLIVGLLGGSYPALYLSRFNPLTILKGTLSKSSSNVVLRRVLVVVQFSISMIMLICTWVVYNQLQYLRNKDLGFNKEQVLSLSADASYDIRSKILAFQNEISTNPHILSVSTSQSVPGSWSGFNLLSIQTKNGFTQEGVSNYAVDENYFKTLGMQIKKGRNFSGLSDTLNSIIVNEKMVKYYGWDNPIGKQVRYPGDTSGFHYSVVGVVKDFNQKALYNPIAPLILFYRPNNRGIQIKLDAKNIPGTVAEIEKAWKTNLPGLPFAYTFLDENFYSQYAADQKRGKIFTTFAVLTILITCLGLLGLIAFTTEQRQKEISIRKIMGAGVGEIVTLIIRNFVLLVGLSCFIAFPVAYIFMHKWLNIFSYNTGLSPTPFLLAAFAVLFITLMTVIYHTMRAALTNPSRNLRSE
jgi:putative ABC transport system permease protein